MKKDGQNRIRCLSEDGYELQMEQVVEPFLFEIRETGSLTVSGEQEMRLYYELYPREFAQGTVVISFGFAEASLKYREMIYYFWQQGYQVAIMDHRGHGKSFRQVEDENLVHVERFSQYVKDLHLFVEKIVKPMAQGSPLYLYGHSMGGGIGVFYLEQYPDDFQKAVLNAPMLGLLMGGLPKWMARTICDVKVLSGDGKDRLLSQHAFDQNKTFENSSAGSQARFAYYHKQRCLDPDYQTSAASYHWGREAINAGNFITGRSQVKKIKTPILLFTAGKDSRVDPKEHRKFMGRIDKGKHVVIPEAKHEIFRETNAILEPYLEEIFTFLEQEENE